MLNDYSVPLILRGSDLNRGSVEGEQEKIVEVFVHSLPHSPM